jgi:hypothetical protein
MPGENFLQTLQRYATIVQRLEDLAAEQREFSRTVAARLDRSESQLSDIRERLARLEAARDADRAEMRAEISRFKSEVERAELQLSRVMPAEIPAQAVPQPPRKRTKSEN